MVDCKILRHCRLEQAIHVLRNEFLRNPETAVKKCLNLSKALECIGQTAHDCKSSDYATAMDIYEIVCNNVETSYKILMCLHQFEDKKCRIKRLEEWLKWENKLEKETTDENKCLGCKFPRANCLRHDAEQQCNKDAIQFEEKYDVKYFESSNSIKCDDYVGKCGGDCVWQHQREQEFWRTIAVLWLALKLLGPNTV